MPDHCIWVTELAGAFTSKFHKQLHQTCEANLDQFRLHDQHRLVLRMTILTRSRTPASLAPPLPSLKPLYIRSKSAATLSNALVNSPNAIKSGPRARMAGSSAGVATPEPGAEGIGSSEYPLGCILGGTVRDLVDDWDVIEGVEAWPGAPSSAANSASMSTCQACLPMSQRRTMALPREWLDAERGYRLVQS